MRLFVAVDLPEHVKERLATIVDQLSACGADVRWVHRDSLHLTLKFLGNVEPKEVGPIDETLSRVAAAAAPATGRLRNVGSFPHLQRPRVIWIGFEAPVLATIQAAVDGALSELGFPREKRRFRPHVTLGRVRSGGQVAALVAAVDAQAGVDVGTAPVAAITLFESRLQRDGARYTPLGAYPLGGTA